MPPDLAASDEAPRLPAPPPPRPAWELEQRTTALLLSSFTALLLGSLMMVLPVPFVVLRPGPVLNTLGEENGKPLISISGRASYPARGNLDLTTVNLSGGPGGDARLLDVLGGWFSPEVSVVPERDLFTPDATPERARQQEQQDMVDSKESATVAALRELGIPVPATITVHALTAAAGATPLRAGDVLVAVSGTRIGDLDGLTAAMRRVTPGSTVPVVVRRAGAEVTVAAPTHRGPDGRALFGVQIDPAFHPPFTVSITIDDVGGPSAGLMFALGIVDELTPGDLTGGRHVAGTGTIDIDGTVGGIGGVQQKMAGARAAGAEWFLVPVSNCANTTDHVPGGLRVVPVTTLHEAHGYVERIAAGRATDTLPRCP